MELKNELRTQLEYDVEEAACLLRSALHTMKGKENGLQKEDLLIQLAMQRAGQLLDSCCHALGGGLEGRAWIPVPETSVDVISKH